MRVFPVVLPSGERYWTVLDEQLAVVEAVDAFLRHVRFGRDQAELTTKAYASAVALFLRWCGRTGRDWRAAAGDLSLFITWLKFAPQELTGTEAPAPGTALVLPGPGAEPVRSPARIASVLVGVRAFLCYAVKIGAAPPDQLPLLYEIGDVRDLPLEARGSGRTVACRLKAQHRVSVPRRRRDRAADEEVLALLVQPCRVPGCQRPWIDAPRALCAAHHWQKNRVHRCSLEEFLARTDLEPLPSLGACAVAACYRDASVIKSMLCHAHNCRLLDACRADPGLDTGDWLATQTAIPEGAEVSFRGLPDLVVAQVLFGLQQRCRDGALTQHTRLRALTSWLRAERVASLDALSAGQASGAGVDRLTRGPLTTMIAAVRRARMTPESEYAKDRWDMAALGMTGFIDFGRISQPWLRETAKRWVRHTAPQRRGERAGNNLRSQVLYLDLLSQSLRTRADRGNDPAGLGRADIEFFLARAARKEHLGEISAHKRRQVIITAGSILKRGRLLGLTRPGEPMNGLADDFALIRGDLPSRPERSEADRDLPPEVMRQLCANLDWLDEHLEREMRVAIELLIDTGRRPDEACELGYDCLAFDNDGKPVLVYGNSKENRPQRQLPLHQATADLIRGQQARVRSRYPRTPAAELKLLPSVIRNPRGRKAISADSLSVNNRIWVDTMPEIRLDDGTVFDKSKIFLYAYRHTFAQRHADAGVAVDVLAMLLDHDTLEATRGYYRVKQNRLRKAVDTVARLQFDRHGNHAWKQAGQLLDAQRARQAVGEVAVAFGRCSEPANVSAGGGQCPLRFRCLGCEHFSTDVSYLPELRSYLDDLLRTRERLQAMATADDWARREAMPSEEIARLRRLIRRVSENLESLTPGEQAEIRDAVTAVRKTRQAFLGIPRVRQPLPDVRPERPA